MRKSPRSSLINLRCGDLGYIVGLEQMECYDMEQVKSQKYRLIERFGGDMDRIGKLHKTAAPLPEDRGEQVAPAPRADD